MAVVTWVGKQIARAAVKTLTVATSDTGGTITVTVGGTQAIVVTPTTATVATTASEICTAAQNAGGCFDELTWSVSGAVVTITGPDDGAPITVSKTDGGTNATSLATVFAPLSPHDASDVVNYSTGALPVDATDSLVFEDSAVDVKYNLTALAALALVSPGFIRRSTYTGRIGLPTTNPAGFPEFRDTELSVKSATYLIEVAASDSADQFRILNTYSAGAVTATIQGPGSNAQIGEEAVVLRGLPASSVVRVVGASVALAPLQGQACTVLTLTGQDATIRVGASATLSGTVSLVNCQSQVKSSWTTSLTMDGGETEVAGSAAGVIVIESGRLVWHSTGNPGASPVIGSNATLDLSQAPTTLTISGTIAMYEGATLDDRAGRGGNFAYSPTHCGIQDVTVITSVGGTWTRS